MDILTKVRYTRNLTPAEQQFAQYLQQHTEKVIASTLLETSAAAFTSKSLIIRFCKKIGLSGFNEMKVRLAQEYSPQRSLVDVNFPFTDKDSQQQIAGKLRQLYHSTIDDTFSFLQIDSLWEIVLTLCKAQQIFIFTHAHNSNIAENFQDKMLSIGRQVNFEESTYKQRRLALMATPKTAALVLSYSGQATFIPSVLSILKQQQATIIWIGRAGNESMTRASDYQLYISDREDLRHRLSQFASHLSMQFTLDLIFSCIFKANYQKNAAYLQDASSLLDDRHI
jgi:DNA-binding MurR/RpiR family transcriptional regulator